MSFIETLIQLPYSRPGNDLQNCIVEDDEGYINVKLTLANMVNLLKQSAKKLEDINNLIPNGNTLDIYGSGQSIGMSGDNEVLDVLLNKGLVVEGVFEEDDEIEFDEIDDAENDDTDDTDDTNDYSGSDISV